MVDASDPDRDQHIAAVDGILAELALAEKPRLLVWNKVDRLDALAAEHLDHHAGGGFPVSALDRNTFGPLLLAIQRELWREGKAAALEARAGDAAAG